MNAVHVSVGKRNRPKNRCNFQLFAVRELKLIPLQLPQIKNMRTTPVLLALFLPVASALTNLGLGPTHSSAKLASGSLDFHQASSASTLRGGATSTGAPSGASKANDNGRLAVRLTAAASGLLALQFSIPEVPVLHPLVFPPPESACLDFSIRVRALILTSKGCLQDITPARVIQILLNMPICIPKVPVSMYFALTFSMPFLSAAERIFDSFA